MRNHLLLALFATLTLTACDPIIRKFEVTPKELACSGQTLVEWEITGPGGHLSANPAVTPALPSDPPLKGSQQVTVTQTTEFSFIVPGAGHQHRTVTVLGQPKAKTLTFSGECTGVTSGPTYVTVNVSASEAPGKLTSIQATNVDFPVHVFVNGTEIALGASGEPLFPLPNIAAAGSYTVQVPGIPGQKICEEAGAGGGGPTGGGTATVKDIQIVIRGSC